MITLYMLKIVRDCTIPLALSCGDVVQVDLKAGDVIASRSEGGPVIASWSRDHAGKPTRRNRYVMLNCSRYAVAWWRT